MQIPWTKELRRVPLIAYSHHERLDGSGYPRGVRDVEVPIQARMMTIADVFDALAASDRPYKRAVAPDKALDILRAEARSGRIDRLLLDLFIEAKVYDARARAPRRRLTPEPATDVAEPSGASADAPPSRGPGLLLIIGLRWLAVAAAGVPEPARLGLARRPAGAGPAAERRGGAVPDGHRPPDRAARAPHGSRRHRGWC